MMITDYDKRYNQRKKYWGNRPHSLVVELNELLRKGASVLDLGCGEGRNASYLARNGFKVTAVDVSKVGIQKVKSLNYGIQTEVMDVVDYLEQCRSFDVIMGINVLQFISSDKIDVVMRQIKAKTNKGGYNVIESFLAEDNDQKNRAVSKSRYLFDNNEMKDYYQDWEIIKYSEEWSKWQTHGEPKHRHYIVQVIARKPI